jgi:hypothetical protein
MMIDMPFGPGRHGIKPQQTPRILITSLRKFPAFSWRTATYN